jgi:hypothetical protein
MSSHFAVQEYEDLNIQKYNLAVIFRSCETVSHFKPEGAEEDVWA